MNTRLKVSETMDKDPLIAAGTTTVLTAARRMRDRGVGSLLVYDQGLRGIVTERDILHKVVAEGRESTELPLASIMSKDLVTVSPEDDVLQALRLMRQHRIRHLPVLAQGQLAGLVTERGISQIAPELIQIADDWAQIAHPDSANGYASITEEDQAGLRGRCEVCGNADDGLVDANGTLLCEECLDTEDLEAPERPAP